MDPATMDWDNMHAAANAANVLLHLEAARLYGLITTDLRVDVEKCEEVLKVARLMGITPDPIR